MTGARGLLTPFFLVGAALAPTSLKPIVPVDGATSGPRPVFRFTVPGEWDSSGRARIELSRDHFKTVERVFDMRESARGFSFFGEPDSADRGGSLTCPEALPEGAWEWRLRAFYHDAELVGARPASFRVDATPPAEVSGLRLERKADGSVLLIWDPVLLDVEGSPESVDHYLVYRYDTRGIFAQPRISQVGEARSTFFLDKKKPAPAALPEVRPLPPSRAGGIRTLYYKVVAVDAAGNELGQRDSGGPSEASPSLRPREKAKGEARPSPEPGSDGTPEKP